MKNTKLVRCGLLTLAMLGIMAGSASAADSGSVTIEGTVDPVNAIVVTSQAGYNDLDLTSGATDLVVAVVNEKNNDPDGYTVSLVSANAQSANSAQARLNGSDAQNATVINYSIKYGTAGAEAAVTLVAGSSTVTSTSAASPEAGSDKNLMITFSGSTWRNADTYSDTLTLTIAAK